MKLKNVKMNNVPPSVMDMDLYPVRLDDAAAFAGVAVRAIPARPLGISVSSGMCDRG